MAVPLPTLSAAGWVRSPAEKADMLFSHFYESDKLQTYIYGNNVSSLQSTIETYGHDPLLVSEQLRNTLQEYLGRYYTVADVDVTAMDMDVENQPGKIKLRIFCRVTEDGKDYSFGKIIEAIDSKLQTVLDLNNNEQGII